MADEPAPGSSTSRQIRPPESRDPSFERLLSYLKESRAFDFTGYKRASLMRRVQHQMQQVAVTSFDDYHDYLQVHPEVKMAPQKPATGIFLIGVNDYLDIWNLQQYDWLKRIPPSGVVAYNGLLITVSEKDLGR